MQLNKRGLMATLMMTTLVLSPLAEAKRVGGGKSTGMSRTTSTSSTSTPQTAPTSYPAQQTQPAGSGVGKMVAAGVAGAAIGAVAANAMADDPTTSADAAHTIKPEEKNNFSWLWILALAVGAFFLFRRFTAKKATANNNPFAPNNTTNQRNVPPTAPFARNTTTSSSTSGDNTNIFGQSVGGSAIGAGAAYTNNGNQLPDGTQPAAFLRQARAKFLHLQSMNSSSNIEEVRRYFTPEMYLAIRDDILSNDDLAEFPQLNAQLADSATENGQFVASVRFSGLVSESLNADAVPFTETWHFVKANGGEWLVAGIQQG